ncbi:DMT family transporter [Arthrobacter sp. B6]|uniref:DMT family transporter n=1 Tax=Arthrobacter sp. B6 TaxID=1570137 RepID=UPI000A5FBF52|nr:SMR family transporter [Arthrobacter sp. B6]
MLPDPGALAAVLRKGLGLGVAYGIWAALGVTLTVLLAALIFGEALTPVMLIGVGMVIGGVLCLSWPFPAAYLPLTPPGRSSACLC